jgi:hypothetical protein
MSSLLLVWMGVVLLCLQYAGRERLLHKIMGLAGFNLVAASTVFCLYLL